MFECNTFFCHELPINPSLFFLSYIVYAKLVKKAYFDQGLEYAAPKPGSKYTTMEGLIFLFCLYDCCSSKKVNKKFNNFGRPSRK